MRSPGWIAIRLAPDDPQVNLALATCLRMAHRPAEAQRYQDRFEKLDADRRKAAAASR